MPKQDQRLLTGTRVHAKAVHVTSEIEAEQIYARLYKSSYFIGEVRGWRVQDTGKTKRKVVLAVWMVGTKIKEKELPLGLIKLGERPPGYEDGTKPHPFPFNASVAQTLCEATQNSSSPRNIRILFLLTMSLLRIRWFETDC